MSGEIVGETCYRCGESATGYVEDGPVCESHYRKFKGTKWRPLVEPQTSAPASLRVGLPVWTFGQDTLAGGYVVSVHMTEAGAYKAALETIQSIADDGRFDRETHPNLFAALEAKDGQKALDAFDTIISNSGGGDATGDVYLSVLEQKIEE